MDKKNEQIKSVKITAYYWYLKHAYFVHFFFNSNIIFQSNGSKNGNKKTV